VTKRERNITLIKNFRRVGKVLYTFGEKKKFPPKKCMEKIYHIYAKDKCLMHSVKEEDFEMTWNTFNKLVGLLKTDYQADDLSYEEVLVNKDTVRNSSY